MKTIKYDYLTEGWKTIFYRALTSGAVVKHVRHERVFPYRARGAARADTETVLAATVRVEGAAAASAARHVAAAIKALQGGLVPERAALACGVAPAG